MDVRGRAEHGGAAGRAIQTARRRPITGTRETALARLGHHGRRTPERDSAPPFGHVEVCMIPDLSPGNRFPDVDLPDHAGNQRRLTELAGGDPLVLNFYRGWW